MKMTKSSNYLFPSRNKESMNFNKKNRYSH